MKEPLVSCVMPTADRWNFVSHAVRNFLGQDYPNKELVILDDGKVECRHLIPNIPSIRYYREEKRDTGLGRLRNKVNSLAAGEIIQNWDDDDWRTPTWISSQVACLTGTPDASLCGLRKMIHYHPGDREAWLFQWPGPGIWMPGGSLCYWRDKWAKALYSHVRINEEAKFIRHMALYGKIVFNEDYEQYVAIAHIGNTVSRFFDSNHNFSRINSGAVRSRLAGSSLIET